MTETAASEQKTEDRDEQASSAEGNTVDVTKPIIIDLGKQRRKRIKALKRGKGRLIDEVLDAVDQVRENLGDEAEGKTLVPVVLTYRRRRRKRNRRNFRFPF